MGCTSLCPSFETQKLLRQNGISKTAIFSRGIDVRKFHPNHRDENLRRELGVADKIVFLYVGRVSCEKDLDVLSESYGKLKEIYRDRISLIITGEGPYLDKCRSMLPADTIFTGFKKGRELSRTYASGDIFICPSSTETFGNVILEAMASGLPVIGADAGGLKEIITHNMNGLKFEARNSVALQNCMLELIENSGLRERLKINGIRCATERSWERIVGGLINEYDEVISNRDSISA